MWDKTRFGSEGLGQHKGRPSASALLDLGSDLEGDLFAVTPDLEIYRLPRLGVEHRPKVEDILDRLVVSLDDHVPVNAQIYRLTGL